MQARALGLAISVVLVSAASADMFKPSKADQVKLGQQASAEVRKKEKILPASDPRVKLLREVGQKVLATMDMQKEPWKFTFDVVDSREVNAFALPGGPVYFYTGLLNRFKTEDQLAGVIAHEVVHVRREHWAYAYADSQKRALGITALLMVFRAGRTTWDLASIGNDLIFELPFSRKHEAEADLQGLEAMVKAGYNPNGMADVFRILAEASKGKKPQEWMSTHPDDGKRIGRIESEIKKLNRTFPDQRPLPWQPENFTAKTLRVNW
jgi:beta-barrel assembly-enhancing protease